MPDRAPLLQALGGEEGCRRLSTAFYAKVASDPILRPLFPGKTQKCAIEEFAAFLIQFLGGDEGQTQRRWWLSLRESHARFHIGPRQRQAWLTQMSATLAEAPLADSTRQALQEFFGHTSAYLTGEQSAPVRNDDLAPRWSEQRLLDDAVAAIAEGRDSAALEMADRLATRPAVFVGLLARMVTSQREPLIGYVLDAVQRDPSISTRQSGGRALIHYAAGAGCLPVVRALLRLGTPANLEDSGGHTPLYRLANQCDSAVGPEIVRALLDAGADLHAGGGVKKTTPLHMAARQGHLAIAEALLDAGASIDAPDSNGCTPLDRAINCRRRAVAQLLRDRGARASRRPLARPLS